MRHASKGVPREKTVREFLREIKKVASFSGFRTLSKLPAQKQPQRLGQKMGMNQPSS